MIGPARETDRGMSVALTHVLTIAITTILIAMLLLAGNAMLDSQTERSTETSLETVGERLAGEIDNVDRIVDEDKDEDTATIVADHPRTIANSQYTIELLQGTTCEEAPLLDDSNPCVKLTSYDVDVTVHVPVAIDDDRIESETSVTGGSVEITYDSDDGITLAGGDR
ncbi:DUF7266 family protein [Natronorubrum texcoconense]|uniref:Uncharacterized protein n=1 Tax=Natronorubrum texcoconense TaxID=1095776 RepID=A0A1G8XVG9_9EURY|nr:hypothetical protein [Natronorubrum texcoconense]SDJ93760.1 hypothetical protein SAMN04515672_1892 [Natronorubrum texcoconense]